MRPAHESGASTAADTPIYDALFAEYRRLFRALPGDRTGEETLRFEAILNRQQQPLPAVGYRQLRRDRTARTNPGPGSGPGSGSGADQDGSPN